jgi:hypothetical protein
MFALLDQAMMRLERASALLEYNDGFIRLIEGHIEQLPHLIVLIDYWRIMIAKTQSC